MADKIAECISRHRFNSDGFCKECGMRESEVEDTDPFCDGPDDSVGFIAPDNPASGPLVAGYLAGLMYMAEIGKYWREEYPSFNR